MPARYRRLSGNLKMRKPRHVVSVSAWEGGKLNGVCLTSSLQASPIKSWVRRWDLFLALGKSLITCTIGISHFTHCILSLNTEVERMMTKVPLVLTSLEHRKWKHQMLNCLLPLQRSVKNKEEENNPCLQGTCSGAGRPGIETWCWPTERVKQKQM